MVIYWDCGTKDILAYSTDEASLLYSATGQGQGEEYVYTAVSMGMVIAEGWGELDI